MKSDHPIMPFLATALAVALFSLMDALMKTASIAVGVYSALLFRTLAGTVLAAPVWLATGGRMPPLAHMRIHLLRATVTCGMALLFFFGLVRLPMAEAIALSFIAPLIALYLAAIMLGERISKSAVIASLLGLAGVAIITMARFRGAPFGDEEWRGVGAVLGSACLYAWNLVLQRRIAQLAPPLEVTVAQNALMCGLLGTLAPWIAVVPDGGALFPIIASAVLATVSLLLLTWAYARAETQTLVPLEYTAFLWAALFGWLYFGEAVGGATLVGVVLIVTGCWIGAPRRTEPTAL